MLAWCGQSALYLAPEPYKLLWLSSKRGSEYSLYFRAVWPFGVHGGTFCWREKWARWGLWLRLLTGWWWCSGCFWLRFGPFGPAGRGVRSPWTGPWFGPGFFSCRFGGRLRCVAVEYAACRFMPLLSSVHTPKLVCVLLQAGGAKFEGSFGVCRPGHPALCLWCPVFSYIGCQVARECEPRPGQRSVRGWGIHSPVHLRFEGQPVRWGWLVWWVECLKGSPSASGVAGFASGVNVWTLSVVPVAFHCDTHHVCCRHVSVTVGASGGLSIKAAQSVTCRP